MRLAKLTGLEREALIAEIKEVGELIARLEAILASEQSLMAVVIERAGGDQEGVRRRAPHRDHRTATSATSTSRT